MLLDPSSDRVPSGYARFYNIYLAILAALLPFRWVSTPLLIGAFVLSVPLMFKINKSHLPSYRASFKLLILASPFILDLLFLWNNSDLLDGFKHAEKRLSLLVLPPLFYLLRRNLNLKYIYSKYTVILMLVLSGLLVGYVIENDNQVSEFWQGIHLWKMGYDYANYTGVHAPALNLHICFGLIVSFWLTMKSLLNRKNLAMISLRFCITLLLLFFLFYVNTRIAVILGILNILLIVLVIAWQRLSARRMTFTFLGTVVILGFGVYAFAKANPYSVKKFTTVTFAHMDKVNKLDELPDPEGMVYNALVTRVSIWNTAAELATENFWVGTGASDGKYDLNQRYLDTDQRFLARHKFPVHNQFIDFYLKFGILGLTVAILFMSILFYIGIKSRHIPSLCFALIFTAANMTDDFLIRYDGIVFAAFWSGLFISLSLRYSSDRSPEVD